MPSSKWETLLFVVIHHTSQCSPSCIETVFKNVKMVLLRIMLDCFHDLASISSFKLMHTFPNSHEQLVWHCVVWETYSGWKGLPLVLHIIHFFSIEAFSIFVKNWTTWMLIMCKGSCIHNVALIDIFYQLYLKIKHLLWA